jgi:hypothetical protein
MGYALWDVAMPTAVVVDGLASVPLRVLREVAAEPLPSEGDTRRRWVPVGAL